MQYSKRAFELTIQRIGQRVLDQVRLEFSREANGLIREEVGKIFEESDAIESMRTGDLKSELGLTRANEKTERLINAIKRSFVSRRRLVLSNANRNRNSLFRINGIPTDYSFLLDSAFAVQLTKKGQRLPWLDWLLLQGRARPIVRDYKISRRARGRSRLPGIMVKGRPGWRPPFRWAGTRSNNFITRELARNGPRLEKAIRGAVNRAVRNARNRVRV